uniref:Uncharacterized protein n=1 Tax=Octopus bimaculoides TaxID=37653 RepID=A0A0L8IAM2_OCTBM
MRLRRTFFSPPHLIFPSQFILKTCTCIYIYFRPFFTDHNENFIYFNYIQVNCLR